MTAIEILNASNFTEIIEEAEAEGGISIAVRCFCLDTVAYGLAV